MGDHEHWRDELAAYLLGSLSAEEAADVERHLGGCEGCREQVRWLRPALEILPESVARIEPPPALKERVMGEVRGEAEQGQARPASLGARIEAFIVRPAVALVAAALIAAALGGYLLRGSRSAPPTTFRSAGASTDGAAAVLERTGDSGMLKLTRLRQLPGSRAYQSWVKVGRNMEPSSMFLPRSDGTAAAAIPSRLNGASAVMVTVEARGGAAQPSSAPVIRVPLR